jgi:hypothetical protein
MGSAGAWDLGFAGQLAEQLDDELFAWTGIEYPAAAFPMGPSVRAGIEELVRQINLWIGKFVLTGYSEGAMVVDRVWRDEILNPNGRLAHRLNDVIGIVNFGDPMRSPGISKGNDYAGLVVPKPVYGFTTGGIAGPQDLTPEETPDFLLSCNNDGDMYVSAPVGDTPWTQETGVGHDMTICFNVVQDFNGPNVLAIVEEAMSLIGMAAPGINLGDLIGGAISGVFGSIPKTGARTPGHVISLVEALLQAGMFIGTGLQAHGDYGKYMPAMVDWVTNVGKANYNKN